MSDPKPSVPALPNINVTPLIDVLLVLLIIFMVSVPLKPSRFRTLIPEPPEDDQLIHLSPRTLIVEIDRDLRLRLIRGIETVAEGEVGDPRGVTARLAAEFAERRSRGSWRADAEHRTELPADERIEKTVFIRAPRSVPYGAVAKTIDGIRGAGASPIGLQTDELTQ